MKLELIPGELDILEELPSLVPGERRYTVKWPPGAEPAGQALMIHTTHSEPVPGDVLEQRRAMAVRMERKLGPHTAALLQWELTPTEDRLVAEHLGTLALRDVLRRRRKLRVEEIFPLLWQIHSAVELAMAAEWPRLSLDSRALLLPAREARGEVPQNLAGEHLKFPPPSLPALSSSVMEFQATMTMDPVAMGGDLQASVPTSSGVYVQSAAELCCELLGQPRRAGAINFQPIPDLGADENEVLRAVLVSPLGDPPCDTLAEFLEALTGERQTQSEPVIVDATAAAPGPEAQRPKLTPLVAAAAPARDPAPTPALDPVPAPPPVPTAPELFDLRLAAPGGQRLLIKPISSEHTRPSEAPSLPPLVSTPEPLEPPAPPSAAGATPPPPPVEVKPPAPPTAALADAMPVARAKPLPARIQVRSREGAKPPARPAILPTGGALVLGEGIMLPPLGNVFHRLRLTPERDGQPIITLSARREVVIGRAPQGNDFVAQFRPRSPMNDSRTLKISRAQMKLAWGRGDVVEIRDIGSQNSSRIGDEALTDATEITGVNRVVVAGEYALRVSRFPTAFTSQRRVIRLDASPEGESLPDDTLMGGGVGIEPFERQVLPYRLAWIQSDIAFALDEKAALYFLAPAAPACQGRFHHYGGAFWVEVIKAELGLSTEFGRLKIGQVAPLIPGQQLQIAGVTYNVTSDD